MAQAVKTAISFPRSEFTRLEQLCKRTHHSRSRILLMAFRTWLRMREQEALEERYVAGYARHPELAADVEGYYKAGLTSLARDSW
ncbi:MAG: hypothetical protein HY737_04035 [Candidatus Omnitrophica bacterium]|nr:hypothetical protein [Candidatus Omnitrophota bacterium]